MAASFEGELARLGASQDEEAQHVKDDFAAQVHAVRVSNSQQQAQCDQLRARIRDREAELADEPLVEERERLTGLVEAMAPQPHQLRAGTEELKLHRQQSVRNHQLLLNTRQRENGNLQVWLSAQVVGGYTRATCADRGSFRVTETALYQTSLHFWVVDRSLLPSSGLQHRQHTL